MHGVVVSTRNHDISGIQSRCSKSRCAGLVAPSLVCDASGDSGVRLRRGVAERVVRGGRSSRSWNGRGVVGIGFVSVLGARKDDAIVAIFIDYSDSREQTGIRGDELSGEWLRPSEVGGSVRGSEGRRDATSL